MLACFQTRHPFIAAINYFLSNALFIRWCAGRNSIVYREERRKNFIDRKFPSDNTIIIQINTLLTY